MKTSIKSILIFILMIMISSNISNKVFAENTSDEIQMSNNSNSIVFESKKNINPKKIWSIKFNDIVDPQFINSDLIKVFDMDDNEIQVEIKISEEDKRIILIYPPAGGYIKGNTYKLICKKLIQSTNGKSLNNEITMEFTIENLISELLNQNESKFKTVLDNPEKHQVQILYTEIKRNEDNEPTFIPYEYNLDSSNYFYPASSIKLSACLLALEKLNNLEIEGLTKDSIMNIDTGNSKQSKEYGQTVSNYIKKILLYSDNNSFNRLYDFLGQKYYNETLWNKGYNDIKIIRRVSSGCSYEQNKYTNPMKFYNNNKIVYEQGEQYNNENYANNLPNLKRGVGILSGGKLYNRPMDFTTKNYASIEVLQNILKAVFFNEYLPEQQQFNLNEEDIDFLKKYMAGDGNGKFKYFICGGKNKVPDDVKIYNKIGQAYGHLIDNAYIVNEKENVEFLLTAVIYTNENQIFNDNIYEYYTIGMPFLKNLGQVFYEYNLNK